MTNSSGSAGRKVKNILMRPSRERIAQQYETLYPPIGSMETVIADGVERRIHLLDTGPPDAEAIVLIHGASGNLRDFAFGFMEQLRAHPVGAGRRLIALDRPGLGHSERGPKLSAIGPPHAPQAQARLLRMALRRRGVRRVLLVGHSLGCAIALAWLLDAPSEVAGLVGVGGVSHPWRGTAGISYDILATPFLGAAAAWLTPFWLNEARAKRAITSIFAPNDAPAGYADYVGVGLALRPKTILANGRDVGFLKPLIRTQAARYGSITAPIELVHGAEDTIVPPAVHAEALQRACPTAQLRLLSGVGHMPHHAEPKTVIGAIGRALERAHT